MEIQSERSGDLTRVLIAGRLDAFWADHLSRALDDHLRQGNDRVHLHMGRVDYISSLGIRALVSAYKKFSGVGGVFVIAEPAENVRRVLELAGLASLLALAPDAAPLPGGRAPAPVEAAPAGVPHSRGAVRYEVFELPGPGMSCRAFGDPGRISSGGFGASDCRSLPISTRRVSLGLGAFGQGFAETRSRFGEFLAVAGAASCQPGDGSGACDTLLTEGDYAPELQALYGLSCEGDFTHQIRFEPLAGGDSVNLSEIVAFALEIAGGPAACIVLAGESAGLVGASLRRSPAQASSAPDVFGFPAVREWISFSADRAHANMSVIVGGVAAPYAQVPPLLVPHVRPLSAIDGPAGHLHAAVFRFRPLPRGALDVASAVRPLFERETTQAVLHLLADDREDGPATESRLTRGVCWVSRLATVDGGLA